MPSSTVTNLPAPITGPAAWKPDDFSSDLSWIHTLDAGQIAALLAVGKKLDGLDLAHIPPDQVKADLAPLAALAQQIKLELGTRGFLLIRGVPVDQLGRSGAGYAFWALGMLLGTGVTQNANGDLLCPVTDVGVNYKTLAEQVNSRGYQSRANAAYHVDPSDVVGLLCMRRAKAGGASTIVSTTSVYNELLARHPEHLAILQRGFPFSRKGQEWPGEAPVTQRIPVFVRHADRVSCRYTRSYILGGADKLGIPLSPAEHAALDAFDAIAQREDMALHMSFEPGDIQLLNNFTIVHGRTEYEDFPEPDLRRFLYRLWLDLGDIAPWNEESDAMRLAHARFGNLGRTAIEWEALKASQTATADH